MRKRWLWIVPMLFVLDRLSKIWANNVLSRELGGVMPLIDGVVHLRFVQNTGAAFSLFSGNVPLLSVLTGIGLGVLLCLLVANVKLLPYLRVGLLMVLAGGLGNFYDRVAFGAVIDFIEPLFVQFAVCNLADVFISCGAALCFVGVLISGRREGDVTREVDN